MCPQRRSILDSLGSSVNTLRELSWETTTLEQQVRNSWTQFGTTVGNFVKPGEGSNKIRDYVRTKPIASLFIAFGLFSIGFPILTFLSFALITILIGCMSFLFIEGSILFVALIVLGSCLLTITLIGLTIGVGLFTVYFCGVKAFGTARSMIGMISGGDAGYGNGNAKLLLDGNNTDLGKPTVDSTDGGNEQQQTPN